LAATIDYNLPFLKNGYTIVSKEKFKSEETEMILVSTLKLIFSFFSSLKGILERVSIYFPLIGVRGLHVY